MRRAVRELLATTIGLADRVWVASSGGADSTALAAAVAFEVLRHGGSAGLVTVDHGLQPGSDAQARRVAEQGHEWGFDPVVIRTVTVGADGGPEAAARQARYRALDEVRGGDAVLLGHTADDQAETVLLGLGRGSGPRSIAGMRPVADGYLRPLLGLRRRDTERACADLGLGVWHDPHNSDRRFRRVRVRAEAIPLLEDVLGGGVVPALARTAAQLRDDLDWLDAIAEQELGGRLLPTDPIAGPDLGCRGDRPEFDLTVHELGTCPAGLRVRVLRGWLLLARVSDLAASHLAAVDGLVVDWRGQGPIDLPGGYRVRRLSGRLVLIPPGTAAHDPSPSRVPRADQE